jgi:hypothetical protein
MDYTRSMGIFPFFPCHVQMETIQGTDPLYLGVCYLSE